MLAPNFLFLFPSYRITGDTTFAPSLPLGIDARAWTFFAVFAILAPPDDHAALVIGLREKILADLASTRAPSWPGGEEEREARLANLNLFLNSLGLDTSQIQ
jgi:DNA topoisomerase 2-associated protein PAT1